MSRSSLEIVDIPVSKISSLGSGGISQKAFMDEVFRRLISLPNGKAVRITLQLAKERMPNYVNFYDHVGPSESKMSWSESYIRSSINRRIKKANMGVRLIMQFDTPENSQFDAQYVDMWLVPK